MSFPVQAAVEGIGHGGGGWIPLVHAAEVDRAAPIPVPVTAAGLPWALVRLDGEIAALYDVCPHRRVPLSAGKVAPGPSGEVLECGYHGWSYDRAGACARIPALGENLVPRGMGSVAVLRTSVAGGLVWGAAGDESDPLPTIGADDVFLHSERLALGVAALDDTLGASVVDGAIRAGHDDRGALRYAVRAVGDHSTEVFPIVTAARRTGEAHDWAARLAPLPIHEPSRLPSGDTE
ncbi:Rieske 2Fe-2S domain-containing protein [Microbacterium thalassium]|uniref:Nitrite reductase/ring-hydroxylating ferredoxin subunit n=1 Tax=Microbacterium thalassium TaxID=362649 RepID=A0A7X0FP65_9MICO|nr:Rieske 2Fe-2S domain-containing protein [Microbacterium thalassium]MBB6390551.1 nitrite reductase/ring-hydroxylating ferredoxin subunit [Microbacterium thalassium]GLK25662.1 hypothetical protein GCM10017607_29810 [Microbacterium thalassium]